LFIKKVSILLKNVFRSSKRFFVLQKGFSRSKIVVVLQKGFHSSKTFSFEKVFVSKNCFFLSKRFFVLQILSFFVLEKGFSFFKNDFFFKKSFLSKTVSRSSKFSFRFSKGFSWSKRYLSQSCSKNVFHSLKIFFSSSKRFLLKNIFFIYEKMKLKL